MNYLLTGIALILALLSGMQPACADNGVHDFLNDPFNTASAMSANPAGNSICQLSAALTAPLSLLDAVERALCRNPQTRLSWANIKAQAAAVGVAQAAYLPNLSAGGSLARVMKQTDIPGFPQFDSYLNTRSSDKNINLSWVLYDFGLRAANLESARQLLNAANATQDDALQTVFLHTVQAFYAAQAAQALLVAMVDAEQAAQHSFTVAQAKHVAGAGALADQLQAQTAYAQATLKRVQADGDLHSALGALAILMGLQPNTPLPLAALAETATDTDAPLFQQAIESLIAEAIQTHPKILAAKAQLKAAQAKIVAARAEGRPTLALVGNTDRSDTPISQVSSRQTVSSRSIGIQINIPLTDGLSTSYKVRSAEAQAESREADLADIEQKVTLEVWNSDQALRTETENMTAIKVLVQSARESFDVAQGRYKAGVGNILELLKAQTDLSSAEQQRIITLTHWQTARLRLAASLARLRVEAL
ncbi:TolC family protein [Glaciimonas sp. GG7]